MNELLYKSVLIEKINEHIDMCCCDKDDFSSGYFSAMATVLLMIKEEPNAYDIDAIVEQLKCATFFTSQNVESIYIGRAIDIVRGGGSRK